VGEKSREPCEILPPVPFYIYMKGRRGNREKQKETLPLTCNRKKRRRMPGSVPPDESRRESRIRDPGIIHASVEEKGSSALSQAGHGRTGGRNQKDRAG